MKKIAILLSLLTAFSSVYAAEKNTNSKQFKNVCMTNIDDPQMFELGLMIKLNKIDAMKTILQSRCFDTGAEKEYITYYLVKSVEAIQLLDKYDRNTDAYDYLKKSNKSNRQLVSELMLAPIYYSTVKEDAEQEGKNLQAILKKYGIKESELEKLDVPIISEEEHQKLLEYVANQTIKKTMISKDSIDFNAYAYSIYLSEPIVLETLLKNAISKRDLTIKNIHELSAVHLAFAPKVYVGSDEKINEEKLKKTNELILEYFDKKYIPLLTFRSMPFWTYVELFKENNIDLYNKLKEKYNFKPTLLEFYKKDGVAEEILDIKKKVIENEKKAREGKE